jgi:hypothetical protein
MDMQFDYNGDPMGGVITDYLLEKVGVRLQRVFSPVVGCLEVSGGGFSHHAAELPFV